MKAESTIMKAIPMDGAKKGKDYIVCDPGNAKID